jgi:hypothetical protein
LAIVPYLLYKTFKIKPHQGRGQPCPYRFPLG